LTATSVDQQFKENSLYRKSYNTKKITVRVIRPCLDIRLVTWERHTFMLRVHCLSYLLVSSTCYLSKQLASFTLFPALITKVFIYIW